MIVEDDPMVASVNETYLSRLPGFCVIAKAADGLQALEKIKALSGSVDLVLLDVFMPKMDGLSFLEHLKNLAPSVSVIMITASQNKESLRTALAHGVADYIIKPFDSKELVARVKAVLRRFQPAKTESVVELKCVEYPDLTVNLSNYSVMYNGHPIDMPPKELELLYFLAASPNQVFTREQLLDHIWGYEYIGDTRTVDVHVKRLREKIKDHETWSIATVWGIGYKFEVKG